MVRPWSHRKTLALLNFSAVALFILYCISISFWSLYPRQGCKLAPFSFRASSYYSFSAPVYFVMMQNKIKWATADLWAMASYSHACNSFWGCIKRLRVVFQSNSLGLIWCHQIFIWVQLGGEGFQVAGEAWYRAVGSVAWSLATPLWPFLIVFMLSLISSLGRRGAWIRFFWGTGMCSIGMR